MSRKEPTARDYILICHCHNEARALKLEALLNEEFRIGIDRDYDTIWLHQLEAEKPYSMTTITLIHNFAKVWNTLTNRMDRLSV